jgi:hypothetical protein
MLPKLELTILQKNSKYAGLAHDNGFGLVYIIAQRAVARKRSSNAVHLQRKECNKYDLTDSQYF